MEIRMILRPCPWCKRTPEIYMPIPDGDTWCWHIYCNFKYCGMKPKSPHVTFRNTRKKDFIMFYDKLCCLAEMWNRSNPIKAIDEKIIDLTKIMHNFDPSSIFNLTSFDRLNHYGKYDS